MAKSKRLLPVTSKQLARCLRLTARSSAAEMKACEQTYVRLVLAVTAVGRRLRTVVLKKRPQ